MPTPEDYGPLIPISLYGASKLACEAFITSYSHTFDMQAWIFRFANIVGPRSTHGITVDFIKKTEEEHESAGNPGRWKAGKILPSCFGVR